MRPSPRRGEVWLVDLGSPAGHEQGYQRPGLVVSADGFNGSGAELVFVAPTTTRSRGWPTHVLIPPGSSGLDRQSWVKVEDLRSVSHRRVIHRLGAVDDEILSSVGAIARLILGL